MVCFAFIILCAIYKASFHPYAQTFQIWNSSKVIHIGGTKADMRKDMDFHVSVNFLITF